MSNDKIGMHYDSTKAVIEPAPTGFREYWGSVVRFLSTLSKIVIIVIALGTGFAAGGLWYRYRASVDSSEMKATKSESETSVAINERGELLVIDRSNGKYEIYGDKVGQMIFDLYASKKYYQSLEKK